MNTPGTQVSPDIVTMHDKCLSSGRGEQEGQMGRLTSHVSWLKSPRPNCLRNGEGQTLAARAADDAAGQLMISFKVFA
jgi:hypothetical protein